MTRLSLKDRRQYPSLSSNRMPRGEEEFRLAETSEFSSYPNAKRSSLKTLYPYFPKQTELLVKDFLSKKRELKAKKISN